MMIAPTYRGRLAPTPSGLLHEGHGRTFWAAAERARQAGGQLLLRIEDLDQARCRPEFSDRIVEDLHWLGISWLAESAGPLRQSQRIEAYRQTWRQLHATGLLYPCIQSRRDVQRALAAPHEDDDREPIFPIALRPAPGTGRECTTPGHINWRFRVPDGKVIEFTDQRRGRVAFTAGVDFGDFLVWRKDGFAGYELAVVTDDQAQQITEVVRGDDLLLSTARQLLLYDALQATPPAWYHVPLVRDAAGKRLAKRDAARGLAEIRAAGVEPLALIERWRAELF